MVNTRLFELGTEPYVLPRKCEHVFYSELPGRWGYSFVVRHDSRGRLIKYNLDDGNEQGSLEEEDDDEEHDQHELDDDDDPTEDVQELVESNDAADNAHEYYTDDDTMSITELDYDYDMVKAYNVDSVSDDMDDDLDEENDDVGEEDDEIY